MTRDEFEELLKDLADASGNIATAAEWGSSSVHEIAEAADSRDKLLAEFDRLTALNAQQQKALRAARRYIIENGALMVEPALMEVQAAIRAAEEKHDDTQN